jgi:uncharacterized protein
MHFQGTQTIKAPIQTVWAYFMDPNKVAECAPGFKTMDILAEDHFRPTLAVGIGPVKATFVLDVHLVDLNEPSHAAMTARGNAGGSAVDMRAGFDMAPETDTTTNMNWTADVNVSGSLASMGARMMEGTAQKLTERFFVCLREKLEASPSASAS